MSVETSGGTPSTRHYDLIIVGAGQVGATLALQLAPLLERQGLRMALVEADDRDQPTFHAEQFDPRVVALTPASQQLYQRLGLWRHIEKERVCPYREMHVWDGEGSGRIGFSADELGSEALGYIVEVSVLVRHIRQALTYQSGVDLLSPAVVRGLDRVESGTASASDLSRPLSSAPLQRLTLEDGRKVSAPLVVAADGVESRVRELAGFAVREWSYDQKAIVTTVRTERPHGYTARQRFMRTGPVALLPLRWRRETQRPGPWDTHYCSIVWSADADLADELMALDDAGFRARLGRETEYALGEITDVDRRHAIALAQRHARDYVRPGVALVGDAAHRIHPLAGQGVNLGLKDVMALATEIERALNRGLPLGEVSIVRRYQRQRLGDNLGMMATMEGFKQLFGSHAPAAIMARNLGLRGVNALAPVKNTLARKAMGV